MHARCPFQEFSYSCFSFFFSWWIRTSYSFLFFLLLCNSVSLSLSIGSPTQFEKKIMYHGKIHRVTELDLNQNTLCSFGSHNANDSAFHLTIFRFTIFFYLIRNRSTEWFLLSDDFFVVKFFVCRNRNRVIFYAYQAIYDKFEIFSFSLFNQKHFWFCRWMHRTN